MTTDLEDTLRAAMRSHTADVLPAPTLIDTVRRGGARRRLRARLTVAATPVLVIAAVLGGVALVPQLGRTDGADPASGNALPAADRALLARPTQGDLAGDRNYLRAAATAWIRNYSTSENADRGIFDHLIGEPTVLWAGSTAAGPAAVVGQAADLRHHSNIQLDHEGPALLYGFVGPDGSGGARVVSDAYPVPGAPTTEAAFIGADRTVLLVLYRGRQVEVSFGRTYRDDARVARDWQPVRFPAGGVAVLTRPAALPPTTVALRPRGPGYIGVGNLADPTRTTQLIPADDLRLPWAGGDGSRPVWLVGPDPTKPWHGQAPDDATAENALIKDLGSRVPQLYPDVS